MEQVTGIELLAAGERPSAIMRAMGTTAERSAFSKAVAAVERYRKFVRASVGIALVARLLFDFDFVTLLRQRANLVVQLPYIGMALLSYLLVMMWMSKGAGDRLGFGMALGLGVIEAVYLLVMMAMQRPFDVRTAWPPVVVALAHLPMAVLALRSAAVYPRQDSKAPWIYGFAVALAFLTVPWVAPAVVGAMGW